MIKLMAAALNRELQDHDIFSLSNADCEAMLRVTMAACTAVASESLTQHPDLHIVRNTDAEPAP